MNTRFGPTGTWSLTLQLEKKDTMESEECSREPVKKTGVRCNMVGRTD
jgi:hypothetical protein